MSASKSNFPDKAKDGSQKPEECMCCGHDTSRLAPYTNNGDTHKEEYVWLCELCAGSYAGTKSLYRHNIGESLTIMQVICQVGNIILDEIRRGREDGTVKPD